MHLAPRILVTGGAGFIGSFLCERLLDQGAEVLCVAAAPMGMQPGAIQAPLRSRKAVKEYTFGYFWTLYRGVYDTF